MLFANSLRNPSAASPGALLARFNWPSRKGSSAQARPSQLSTAILAAVTVVFGFLFTTMALATTESAALVPAAIVNLFTPPLATVTATVSS